MCYDCDCERKGFGRNKVCWNCRKFSNNKDNEICSRCHQKMQSVTPRFRPPKNKNKKKWISAKKIFYNIKGILG